LGTVGARDEASFANFFRKLIETVRGNTSDVRTKSGVHAL